MGPLDLSRDFFRDLKKNGITEKSITKNINKKDLKKLSNDIIKNKVAISLSNEKIDAVFLKEAEGLLNKISEIFVAKNGVVINPGFFSSKIKEDYSHSPHKIGVLINKELFFTKGGSISNLGDNGSKYLFDNYAFANVAAKKSYILNLFKDSDVAKDIEKNFKIFASKEPAFQHLYGILLEASGKTDKAYKYYEKAAKQNFLPGMMELGLWHERQGNYDQAIDELEKIEKIVPYSKDRNRALGMKIGLMHELKGDYSQALKMYREWMSYGFNTATQLPGRCYLNIPKNRLNESDYRDIGALADAHYEFKHLNLALEYFNKLAEAGYKEAEISLGHIYKEWGDFNLALQHYEKGDPEDRRGFQREIIDAPPWDEI